MKFLILQNPVCAECNLWLKLIRPETGDQYWLHPNANCQHSMHKYKIQRIELEPLNDI